MPEAIDDILNPQLLPNISPIDTATIVDDQVSALHYLLPPEQLRSGRDRTYSDNEDIWKAIIDESLRATVTVTLRDFWLFEWFPRSPGLYHTFDARMSREMAMGNIVEVPKTEYLFGIDDAKHLQEYEDSYLHGTPLEFMYIFDPHGKMSMLKGGIGSIRFKSKHTEWGRVWFMTASSTSVAHEGFPVALPDIYYQACIDRVATQGVFPCTLVGKLRFLPEPLVSLYEDYRRVPQLYLQVEEVRPGDTPLAAQGHPPRVSVAVSFESRYEDVPKMYASYVTFFPGQKGSLKKRVDWLEGTYVEGMYQGRIVTDFDEQSRRFFDAVFSLEKVMNLSVQSGEVQEWFTRQRVAGSPDRLLAGIAQLRDERVQDYLIRLRDQINDSFQLNQIKILCFNLNIDYENLRGETKIEKAQVLVDYCSREDRLSELVGLCRDEAPNADWENPPPIGHV